VMASKADTTMLSDSVGRFTVDVANRVTSGGICDHRQRNETLSSDVACRSQASTQSKSDCSIRPRINSSGGESGMALRSWATTRIRRQRAQDVADTTETLRAVACIRFAFAYVVSILGLRRCADDPNRL
jgi:hypothetical protein